MNNQFILGYLILIICFVFSCNEGTTKLSPVKSVINIKNSDSISYQDTLIGVLVWKTSNSTKNNSFLLNGNHKKELSFKSLEEFGLLKLHPFQYSNDYEILIIRVVNIDKNYYYVCTSEIENQIKLISRNDRNFYFQTWEENILTAFAIDFNSTENPLYQSINSKKTNQYSKDEFYHPLYIQGDWLCIEDDDGQQSFIKWCRNGRLLIEIFYTA